MSKTTGLWGTNNAQYFSFSPYNSFREFAGNSASISLYFLQVCEKLNDASVRMNELDIGIFSPFSPMLSEELDIRVLEPIFAKFPLFYIETKMDGERFQIHMKQGVFKYFSRYYGSIMNFPSSLGVLLCKPRPDIDTLLCSIGLDCVKKYSPRPRKT